MPELKVGDGIRSTGELDATSTVSVPQIECLIYKYERLYDDENPHHVLLHGRRLDTDEHIVLRLADHYPFYYAQGWPNGDDRIREVSDETYHTLEGHEVTRIYLEDPSDTNTMRERSAMAQEADVPYVRRTLVDTGLWGVVDVPEPVLNKADENGVCAVSQDALEPVNNRPDVDHRVAYMDIETAFDLEEGTFDEQAEAAEQPVIAIGVRWPVGTYVCYVLDPDGEGRDEDELHDNDLLQKDVGSATYIISRWFEDEGELIREFFRLLEFYGVEAIAGWNSDDFDIPYLIKRARNLGVDLDEVTREGYVTLEPLNVPGVQLADLLPIHRKATYDSFKRNTLAYVANHFADIELNKDPKQWEKFWRERTDDLIQYNLRDVEATYLIDDAQQYSDFGLATMYLSYTENYANVDRPTVLYDSLLIREAQRRGLALPMVNRKETAKVQGAKVFDPEPGLYENVAGIDASSLYPSCIVAGNLSYETYVDCDRDDCDHFIVPGVEHHFDMSEKGLIPAVVEQVWEMKKEFGEMKGSDKLYDILYDASKIILNSAYGIPRNKYFRLKRPEVTAGITALGREMVGLAEVEARDAGFVPVYGDTDSVYVHKEGSASVSIFFNITDRIQNRCQNHAEKLGCMQPDIFQWELEKVADRALFASKKKRYALRVVWKDGHELDEPELSVTGFETVRSETPQRAADVQERTLEAILMDEVDPLDHIDTLIDWYTEIEDGKRPIREVAPTPRVKKPLSQYDDSYYSAAACRWSNEHLGTRFGAGSRPYLVRRQDGPPNYIAIDDETDVPEHVVIDWKKHAQLCVENPVKRIYEALGLGDRVTNLGSRKLESWF